MDYFEFLSLIRQNTNNKLDDYKELCRFCLIYQPGGIDVSNDDYGSEKQREDILNNYVTITKQYLPTTEEYPKFVCSSCEANLRQCALFTQQTERNGENWKLFLKKGTDVKYFDEFNEVTVAEIEEIKIECCDQSSNNVPDTETNLCDASDPPSSPKVETIDDTKITEFRSTNGKIDYSERRPLFVNLSTEYERTCKLCDEPTFLSLARFYKHQREHHPNEKSFICDICGSGFNNKSRLILHMEDRHANCGKKFQCQFCAKLFYSDREVKGHEKLHLNVRSYVCNLCGKGFNTKTCLNVHMKSKFHNSNYKTVKYKKRPNTNRYKNSNAKKVFRCELCVPSSVFPSPEERTAHRNALHRKFECNICKNSFMAQESLDSHKLLHSDKPRPFECTVCHATFNQSSHLSSHFKRKHTDEKTFHCTDCKKSFFESCELNAHIRLVHRKQERIKCSKCTCDFATEKYLQKHILQKHMTGELPYDCKICGKRTENGVKLDHHRLKYHKLA